MQMVICETFQTVHDIMHGDYSTAKTLPLTAQLPRRLARRTFHAVSLLKATLRIDVVTLVTW